MSNSMNYMEDSNTIKDVMSKLVNITSNDIQKRGAAVDAQNGELQVLIDGLNTIIEKHESAEALLAFVGETDGGKSTIINMIVGYPLLPSSNIPTSETPVELAYGEQPSLEVIVSKAGEKKQTFFFNDPKTLDNGKKWAIVQYVNAVYNSKIIMPENIDYYYDFANMTDADKIDQFCDVYRAIQLILVPLAASIGRGDPKSETKYNKEIRMQRELLSKEFDIEQHDSYYVRIRVPSEILKQHLVVADLPGLGSGNQRQDEITKEYMAQADAYVLPFDVNGINTSSVVDAMGTIVKFEKMNHQGNDYRFLIALNKCDAVLPKKRRNAIDTAIPNVSVAITDIQAPIYPISAYYAEFRLVANGVDPERANMAQNYDELKNLYAFEFEYSHPQTGQDTSTSTKYFIEEIIGTFGPKICFVNAVNQAAELMTKYAECASHLSVQLKLIQLLITYGDNHAKDLINRMESALDSCRADLEVALSDLQDQMRKNVQALREDAKQAMDVYERGFSNAEKILKGYIAEAVRKFRTNALDQIIIDEEAVIQADLVQGNKEALIKLRNDFKNFSFDSFLDPGDKLIEQCFGKEQQKLDECIDTIRENLDRFIDAVKEKLNDAYKEFEAKILKQAENGSNVLGF